jgi:hypothetical protein
LKAPLLDGLTDACSQDIQLLKLLDRCLNLLLHILQILAGLDPPISFLRKLIALRSYILDLLMQLQDPGLNSLLLRARG